MQKKLYKVQEWNAIYRGTIMAYTLGNGSMIDTPRQRGYVVQKWRTEGGGGSRFYRNKALALADLNSETF